LVFKARERADRLFNVSFELDDGQFSHAPPLFEAKIRPTSSHIHPPIDHFPYKRSQTKFIRIPKGSSHLYKHEKTAVPILRSGGNWLDISRLPRDSSKKVKVWIHFKILIKVSI
jgi:hypothetical protein